MIVGIVGYGVVGSALASVFRKGHEVLIYDINPERNHCSLPQLVKRAQLTFVCLPTPQRNQDRPGYDLSILEGFFDFVRQRGWTDHTWVIKSTVPIGTTDNLKKCYGLSNVFHSPEFLTARTAFGDAANPRLNLIGAPGDWRNEPSPAELLLDDLYSQTYPDVATASMLARETEAVKLVMNAFFAVKVAFFNEAHSLLTKLGCSYSDVITAMVLEGRVSALHTKVPGPDGQYGFGGTCLPKDLSAFCEQLKRSGLIADVSAAAIARNKVDRRRMA